nr:hypothetical protein [Tanacetum cinerariifolium]
MNMDTTNDQQVAMDEALVPHAQRLRIGRSNFRLLSNIKYKESTLQLVYDVLRLCSFFKAFLVTADVPEIYMQEFWATTTVHHHAIRFKIDNKKHIVNLESFRDILHICPRVPGQSFVEPLFEEEILAFIYFLRHNARNVDYAYLMWEDFVYQVEHKVSKKSNEMYCPRFTKVIIHHFMSKDPSISRRNKVNWHYVRDDHMFSTIKLVSRHQNTQQFGALLPIELTNEEIRNSNVYKEYYAVAIKAAPPKPKASVWKTRSSSDTTITPPTAAAGPRLTTSVKGKQAAKASKAKSLFALSEVAMTEAQQLKLVTKRSLQHTHISQASGSGADEGTGSIPGVLDVPTDESEEELSWNSTEDEGDGEGKDGNGEEGDGDDDDKDNDGEEGDDDDDQEVERDDEKDDGDEGKKAMMKRKRKINYTKTSILIKEGQSSSVSLQFVTSMLNPTLDVGSFNDIWIGGWKRQSKWPFKYTLTVSVMKLKKKMTSFSKLLMKTCRRSSRSRSKNKSRNLYKALVEAYESDKIILDTYGETITLKRRHDDNADKDKEPFARPNRGSKRCREGKEPESASDPIKTATRSAGRIIAVTKHKIVEWHNYKHLDWIIVRRDDDKLYKFKEGDFKRLRIQDIEDMLLLLVEGKLTNLTVEERFAFNVSFRMFTRSIVIQRHVEDLQLGVESYHKKLNLTKPDTYRSDLKCNEAYIAYSNP